MRVLEVVCMRTVCPYMVDTTDRITVTFLLTFCSKCHVGEDEDETPGGDSGG